MDEQIAKAKEILGMNHHENIGFACTDSHFNDDIACDRSPYIESLPSAKLDFRTGGSGTAIAISDEQVSKATMLRGAKQEDYDETHAEDVVAGNSSPSVTSHPSVVPSLRCGGRGTAVAISDEQIAKAIDLLGMKNPEGINNDVELMCDPVILRFKNGGSGQTIANSGEGIAKATKLLVINHPEEFYNDEEVVCDEALADIESSPSVIIGFQTGGSSKAIEVSDEQIANATNLLGIFHNEDIEMGCNASPVAKSVVSYSNREAVLETSEADYSHDCPDNTNSKYRNINDDVQHGDKVQGQKYGPFYCEASPSQRHARVCEEEMSSSPEALPIVTPAALASNVFNHRLREAASVTSSPTERLRHTPLNEMTNVDTITDLKFGSRKCIPELKHIYHVSH